MEYIMAEIISALTDNDANIKFKHDFVQIQAEIHSWICANISAESW